MSGFYLKCNADLKWVNLLLKYLNPLTTNPTKWSNTLKQLVDF